MPLWPNSSNFVSSDQRTFLQKVRSLSPCAVATRSLAFLWRFWSRCFVLAEWPFRLGRYRTCFIVDIVPVSSSIFTRTFAVVLGLIRTFRTKVGSSLGDRTRMTAAWSHGGYIYIYYCTVYAIVHLPLYMYLCVRSRVMKCPCQWSSLLWMSLVCPTAACPLGQIPGRVVNRSQLLNH